MGFLAHESEFELFTDLDLNFYSPTKISNAIIFRYDYKSHEITKIIAELECLSCKDLVLIALNPLSLDDYLNLEKVLSNTRLKSLEIFTKYDNGIIKKISLLNNLSILTKIHFFDSPNNDIINFGENNYFDILYHNFNISDFKFCGVVKTEYFNTNMPKILESLNHNSCLHKKISIDKDGYIRNCPSMPQHFGNI